jgi:hypothetical protein
MPQTKIEGKFYPLQHEEWVKACQELTPAQKDVLYYIRTLDPYSDGVELSPAEIARSLSTPNKIVHRSTVGRALKVLEEKGFIDLELLRVKVRVLGKGLHERDTSMSSTIPCCAETTVLPPDNLRDRDATKLPPGNKRDRDATSAIVTQQPEAETQSEQKVQNPKTIKTYSDFIKTLSESERENFLNFVEEQIKNLSQPINDIEAWLASKNQAQQNRWEIYYKNFLASLKSKGLDPQKPPVENKYQQAAKKHKEELEQRKKAAQFAWEKRQLEQQRSSNSVEVKVQPQAKPLRCSDLYTDLPEQQNTEAEK